MGTTASHGSTGSTDPEILVHRLWLMGLSLRAIASNAGLSTAKVRELIDQFTTQQPLPDPVANDLDPHGGVPLPIGIYFGPQPGWSKSDESRPGDPNCPRCGGERSRHVRPGSRWYCAACSRSGFDATLHAALATQIRTEATRKKYQRGEARPTARRLDGPSGTGEGGSD